jgi:hypothetical protein
MTESEHSFVSKEEIMATELDITIDNVKERLGKLREYL